MPHRYIKSAEKTSAPTILISAAAEFSERAPDRSQRSLCRIGTAVHCMHARRRRGGWSCPDDPGRLDRESWWNWLTAKIPNKGRAFVVCPVASDFLTLSRFWRETDRGRFRLIEHREAKPVEPGVEAKARPEWVGQLVLAGTPDIITARCDRGSVCFVSLSNFTRAPFEQLAQVAGVDVSPLYRESSESPPAEPDPIQWKQVCFGVLRKLIDWWIGEGNGPWRQTGSQLVLSLWRTRFYTGRICRHDDKEAGRVEELALHGGRASVWYYGDIGDRKSCPDGAHRPPPPSPWSAPWTELHRLDVSAMYPALLRDRRFPTRLVAHYGQMTPEKLEQIVRHSEAIASVRLRTQLAEFPFRHKGRVGYPVGEFCTTLAGPELRAALERGDVVDVYEVNRYDSGRPFAALMRYLLAERTKARERGDSFMELLFKSWAVGFGGKFAQRTSRWEFQPNIIPPFRWGPWRQFPDPGPDRAESIQAELAASGGFRSAPAAPVRHLRALAGRAYLRVDGMAGANLLAAVFAYLTSYGRLQMAELRSELPRDAVVAQDTDGLFVTDTGLELVGQRRPLTEREPGKLRLVQSHKFARFFTPRHYYTDGHWTLAGVSDGFIVDSPTRVRQYQVVNPVRGSPKSAPMSVRVYRSVVDLNRIPLSGDPGPDGWAEPPIIATDQFGRLLAAKAAREQSVDD